jgi:hypothetical protein
VVFFGKYILLVFLSSHFENAWSKLENQLLQRSLNVVNALGLSMPLHEVLLWQELVRHLNCVSRKQWEMKAVSQGMTEIGKVIKFLEGNCQVLELFYARQHRRNDGSSDVAKLTKHSYYNSVTKLTLSLLMYTQGVPRVKVTTSGECSLC